MTVLRGIDFPYIHDLARLMDILESHGEVNPGAVRHADRLAQYAIAARHPGFNEPVTDQDYGEAVELAKAVIRWAEMKL